MPGPDFSDITTVIFDMDGTLIEHTWQLDRICTELFSRFANQLAPLTEDEFFECYWHKSTDLWYMMIDRLIDGETAARYGYVNTLRSLGQDPALADEMLRTWQELVLEEAVPFSDTYTVLDAVTQNYTTGILTNGFTHFQRQKIDKYHLADHVDFVLISEEAGFHKPDPRIFSRALELAGKPASHQTLHVGDNLDTDIQGALAAGITPVFMNPKRRVPPPEGVLSITTLSELLELLNLPAPPLHLEK